jgi:hypothetical protein
MAQTGGGDLEGGARSQDVEVADPARPSVRRRGCLVPLVVIFVIAAAIPLVAVLLDSDDESAPPAASGADPVPLVLSDAAASDFEQVAAFDATDDEPADDGSEVWLHAPEGDAHPWPTVVIETIGPTRRMSLASDMVDLGVVDGSVVSEEGVHEVTWAVDGSTDRTLASSDIPELELVALARAVVQAGSTPGELPGYVAIAETEPWMYSVLSPDALEDGGAPRSRTSFYASLGTTDEIVMVATFPGSAGDWQALSALSPDAGTYVVRGTTALVTDESVQGVDGVVGVVTVAWMEDDATVAMAWSSGPLTGQPARERAIALVGDLEALDEEAWDAFLAEHAVEN